MFLNHFFTYTETKYLKLFKTKLTILKNVSAINTKYKPRVNMKTIVLFVKM